MHAFHLLDGVVGGESDLVFLLAESIALGSVILQHDEAFLAGHQFRAEAAVNLGDVLSRLVQLDGDGLCPEVVEQEGVGDRLGVQHVVGNIGFFDAYHAGGLGVTGHLKLCRGAFDDLALDEDHVRGGFLVLEELGLVGGHADVLVEGARTVVRVVGGLDVAFLTGGDGALGVVGRRAAAARTDVREFQRLVADVREDELAGHFTAFFLDFAKVVGGVLKLDFRLRHAEYAGDNRYQ